ncbi:MAG: pilus assembly protein PilX [Burkholderiales bacterium PBB5]|nr:MAG: pilus assembly protein PilX [Burkholderiales bacterium PBB5]
MRQPVFRAARGFSLMVILVMIVVVSFLALGAMNSSIVQERMAGNARDRNVALQAAEAALRDAELDIENNLTTASVFSEDCTSGLCIPPSDTASGPKSAPLWQTIDWASKSRAYGSRTSAPALLGPANTALATQPRYVIERLPTLPPRAGEDACVGGGCSNVAVDRARAYRITVRASGVRSATEVMLQSVYVKQ